MFLSLSFEFAEVSGFWVCWIATGLVPEEERLAWRLQGHRMECRETEG